MRQVPSPRATNLPHPPAAPNAARRVARRCGIIAAILLAFLAGGLLGAPHFWQIGRAIGPSCSIGINGTTAVVTVQGWSAPLACQTITHRLAGATRGLSAVVLAPRHTDLTAPLVCRTEIAHDQVTVRDRGALKLVGTLLCTALDRGTVP